MYLAPSITISISSVLALITLECSSTSVHHLGSLCLVGGDRSVRSSRPAWATEWRPCLKTTKTRPGVVVHTWRERQVDFYEFKDIVETYLRKQANITSVGQ